MDENKGKLTLARALRMSEFWLLLVAMAASMFGVSPWLVVPLVTAGLCISSLPKYIAMWPRAREVGAASVWWRVVGLSTAFAFLLALLTASIGHFTVWLLAG